MPKKSLDKVEKILGAKHDTEQKCGVKERRGNSLPVVLVWKNGWEVRSSLQKGNTGIEKHIEGQTLRPDGNGQQAADDPGLRLRGEVQCRSLCHC